MTLGAFGLGYLQKALGQCRYRAACTKESLLRLDREYFSAGLCQRGAEQQSCQDLPQLGMTNSRRVTLRSGSSLYIHISTL